LNKINFENLLTKFIGRNIFYYETIDSTQKEAWRKIENNNIENGSLIIANIQTSGVGTHGRAWHTEKNNNIAFSTVLFPNCDISKLDNLTYDIAEILVEIFKKIYQIDIDIKLPNDLIINNKKVGGILTETKLQGNRVKDLVIGIGINTNQNEISEEIKDISTSIKNEFNIDIDNYLIISEFCNMLEKRLGE
jgi:BirA family biotin operon repressor/biotin-[acetyl-CoA-carboxylase] ligase